MLSPVICDGFGLDLDRAEDIIGEIGLEGRRETAVIRSPDPERTRVCLLLDIHAPVAFVQEPNSLAGAVAPRDIQGHGQGVGERVIQSTQAQLGTVDSFPAI